MSCYLSVSQAERVKELLIELQLCSSISEPLAYSSQMHI